MTSTRRHGAGSGRPARARPRISGRTAVLSLWAVPLAASATLFAVHALGYPVHAVWIGLEILVLVVPASVTAAATFTRDWHPALAALATVATLLAELIPAGVLLLLAAFMEICADGCP